MSVLARGGGSKSEAASAGKWGNDSAGVWCPTCKPHVAATCAMPAPIWPAPTTPNSRGRPRAMAMALGKWQAAAAATAAGCSGALLQDRAVLDRLPDQCLELADWLRRPGARHRRTPLVVPLGGRGAVVGNKDCAQGRQSFLVGERQRTEPHEASSFADSTSANVVQTLAALSAARARLAATLKLTSKPLLFRRWRRCLRRKRQSS